MYGQSIQFDKQKRNLNNYISQYLIAVFKFLIK